MTREQFVRNLKLATLDNAARDEIRTILDPSGRKPDRSNDDIAVWFRSLGPAEQDLALRLAQLAGNSVLFGVLSVLDGVRAVNERGSPGELKLSWTENGVTQVLNDDNEMLHDILNGLIRNQS
jgi:hypothetical protein